MQDLHTENSKKVMEERPGYKHTKLGWIPEDWEIYKVSDCALKIGSGSTPKGGSQIYVSNGIPFIRSQNVVNNRLELDLNSCIPIQVHESMKNTIVKSGDVLLNITGASIGRSCVVPKDFQEGNVNQHVCIIRTKQDRLLNYYLQFYLSSFPGQKNILKMQVGGNREGLNHSGVGSILLPAPSVAEQQSIVDVLNVWDTAITKLNSLIKAKQKQKKALIQQLLTGKKRLPGFNRDWERKRIEDIATEYAKKNISKEQLEVLSCTKYDGLVPSLEYFGRQVFGDDLSNYKVVPKGFYAYATNHIEEGSIGYQNVVEIGLVSPMYTVFKTETSIYDDFFFRLLKSHRLIHEYNRHMEGSINRRGGLRWKNFKRIKITIPEFKEQVAISSFLDIVDTEIQLLEQKLDLLKLQKKGLMQQLLTGKKRLID
jgi:type I restriction enzyme S subunit